MRADDEIRTRDPNLGKVVLYQLSHIRVSSFEDLDTLTQVQVHRKLRLCVLRLVFPSPARVSACVTDLTVHDQINSGNFICARNPEANGFLNNPANCVRENECVNHYYGNTDRLLAKLIGSMTKHQANILTK